MEYLRETVIRDIAEILSASDEANDLIDRYRNSGYSTSIAKTSKDLIMTFPVLCTNTLDPKTATMVSKAIERKCVTMLHIIFSAITVCDVRDAQEFIARYHNNIRLGTDIDTIIQLSIEVGEDLDMMESAKINTLVREALEDSKGMYRDLEFIDSINEKSIQDYRVTNYNGETYIVPKYITEAPHMFNGFCTNDDTKYIEGLQKQLLNSDVKKCNELVPSLLVVRINLEDGTYANVIVGVKAKLIPVDSFEIINKIFVKTNDKNTLLKLIRCTTRELSFFKDFLFAIEKAKVDAMSQSRRGSVNPIWKVLERRSIKSKIKKSLRANNDASAITSLVMAQEEVNYLKNNYNINIESISTAKSIMDSYNFLSLVIVDESIEVVKFFFDGDDSYETLSFNNLERESGDGMYKKVITLMSKMNR